MALRHEPDSEDDRLALAIGKYVLGEFTLSEAATFARVDERLLLQPFDAEQVLRAIELSEQLPDHSESNVEMMDVPPGTALGESSPVERYRSAKESAQARVADEDIDEGVVEDAIEWARTE